MLGSDFEPVLCIDEKPGTKGPNSKRTHIKFLCNTKYNSTICFLQLHNNTETPKKYLN